MAQLNRKSVVVGVVGIFTLCAAGGAVAYWTQSGSGTGSADTDTTVAITVNQTSVVPELYPGQAAQALSGNFDNPNPGPVYVTQVSVAVQTGWSSQTDVAKPACTASDVTLVQPTATNTEVAAGTAQGSWSGASIQFVNKTTNQDNCKGVSVPLVYTNS